MVNRPSICPHISLLLFDLAKHSSFHPSSCCFFLSFVFFLSFSLCVGRMRQDDNMVGRVGSTHVAIEEAGVAPLVSPSTNFPLSWVGVIEPFCLSFQFCMPLSHVFFTLLSYYTIVATSHSSSQFTATPEPALAKCLQWAGFGASKGWGWLRSCEGIGLGLGLELGLG